MLRTLSLSFLTFLVLDSASAGRTPIEMFYQKECHGPICFETSGWGPLSYGRVNISESIRYNNQIPKPLKSALESKIEGCFNLPNLGFHTFSEGFFVPYTHVNQLLICVADFLASKEGKDYKWLSDNAGRILAGTHSIKPVKPSHLKITLSPEDKIQEALNAPTEEKLLGLLAKKKTSTGLGTDFLNTLGNFTKSEADFSRVVTSLNESFKKSLKWPLGKIQFRLDAPALKALSENGLKLFRHCDAGLLLFEYERPDEWDWNLVVRIFEMGGKKRKLDVGNPSRYQIGFLNLNLTQVSLNGICKVIETGNVSGFNAEQRGLTIQQIQRIIDVSARFETPRTFNFADNQFSDEEGINFLKTLPEGFDVSLGQKTK